MDKRATMIDVAEHAGVSQATVSLVLNRVPHARISGTTRRRVLEAADLLGYRKGKGHHVPEGRTRVIGLMIDDVTSTPFATPFIEGACDEAALQDVAVATFCTRSDPTLEKAALELLEAQRAIGLIYASLVTRQITVPPHLNGLPVVLLNCHERKQRHSSVVPSDIAGAYMATEALLKAGHRRIGHLRGERLIAATADRELGFRRAMEHYGVPVDEGLLAPGGWTVRAGREFAAELLTLPDPPTALFCYNDRMALGVYEAARALGIGIPRDLSVIGFDNEDIIAYLDPPLTTMVLPHDEMARWAVGHLLDNYDAIGDDTVIEKVKIECELLIRESIAPPRA